MALRVGLQQGLNVGLNAGFSTALSVVLADSIDPVITSANYSYTIVVTNTGQGEALSVSAALTLDAQSTFVSATGTGWACTHAAGVVTCTRPSISPGQVAPTITVTVLSAASAETSSATVVVTGGNFSSVNDTETTTVELVSFDAGAQRRVPADNTEWGRLRTFFGLTIGNPDYIWLCQETSGNLADVNGVTTLSAVTSPLYSQVAGPWTRTGVGGDDNTNDRFGIGPAPLLDPATTSQVWLLQAHCGTLAAGTRRLMGINNTTGTNSVRLQINGTNNRVACQVGGNVANGTINVPTGIHIYDIHYNRATSEVACAWEGEWVPGTWSATIADGAKGFGTINTPGDYQMVYGACWRGTNGEWTQAQHRAVMQALNWTVTW